MTKRLLIVEGWDIAVDSDYVNSLDSEINDVKNKIKHRACVRKRQNKIMFYK